jgi:hypothetical protein
MAQVKANNDLEQRLVAVVGNRPTSRRHGCRRRAFAGLCQLAGYWRGSNVADPSNRGDDSVGDRFGNGSFEGTAAIVRDHHEKMAALYAQRDRELQDEWRCGK